MLSLLRSDCWVWPAPSKYVDAPQGVSGHSASTDLRLVDFQFKQCGITHVTAVGLLANTCIGSTGRFAMELGYHVTLVRDATAAFNRDMMRAAHELNGPTFAHAILKTSEPIAALDHAAVEAQP